VLHALAVLLLCTGPPRLFGRVEWLLLMDHPYASRLGFLSSREEEKVALFGGIFMGARAPLVHWSSSERCLLLLSLLKNWSHFSTFATFPLLFLFNQTGDLSLFFYFHFFRLQEKYILACVDFCYMNVFVQSTFLCSFSLSAAIFLYICSEKKIVLTKFTCLSQIILLSAFLQVLIVRNRLNRAQTVTS
jgi:hypothetical protein